MRREKKSRKSFIAESEEISISGVWFIPAYPLLYDKQARHGVFTFVFCFTFEGCQIVSDQSHGSCDALVRPGQPGKNFIIIKNDGARGWDEISSQQLYLRK